METHRYQWMAIGAYGCLWIGTGVYGGMWCLWIPMDRYCAYGGL